MKNRVIIILLSVVSICACTENESFPSEATTVNAVLEGYTWHTGDMISLFDGGKNLLLTSFTEGEKACFEAETLPNKALVVFPGNKSYELTDMDLEVSFTAKPRVIPEEKLGGIATAAYNGGDLSFAYVNSFLEFTVSRDDISSLSFTSDAQHPISGDFILSFKEDGSASLSATQSSGNTVTFDSEMLKGTYRLAVPKGSYSSITVKMTASDGMIEKEITSVEAIPGKPVSLGIIDVDGDWVKTPLLEIIDVSSSTAAFTWTTSNFEDPYEDTSVKWTAAIYSDAECRNAIIQKDIASTEWGKIGALSVFAYGGPFSPRLVFAGLDADKDYWCKVWRTETPSSVSVAIKVHTSSSSPRSIPQKVSAGDLLLNEDFSEMIWGDDVPLRCKGLNPSSATDYSKSRLIDWDVAGSKSSCAGFYYICSGDKLGIPKLSCLESKSKVVLSFKVHPFKKKVFGNLDCRMTVSKGGTVLDSRTFTMEAIETWQEFSTEFTVIPDAVIEFSGELFIDDICLELVESYSAEKLFRIYTASDLQDFLDYSDLYNADDETVVIENDIDLSGIELRSAILFNGTLDGNGKSLKNWNSSVPLFNRLNGKISNLTIDHSCSMTIPANDDCAFFAINNSGVIENCTNNAPIATTADAAFSNTAPRSIGAIAAVSSGSIVNCTNNGSITLAPAIIDKASSTAQLTAAQYIGGIAGQLNGINGSSKLTSCTNTGTISYTSKYCINGKTYMGGVAGGTPATLSTGANKWANCKDNTIIKSCVNSGNVTYSYDIQELSCVNEPNIGGVAGYVEGSMADCINNGNVSVKAPEFSGSNATKETYYLRCSKIGGVAGTVAKGISGCSNSGDISLVANISNGSFAEYVGSISNPCLGGVVGEGPLTGGTSDCHNSGAISIHTTKSYNSGAILFVGGVTGYTASFVKSSDNSGPLEIVSEARDISVGGVAGKATAQVIDCNNMAGGTINVTQNIHDSSLSGAAQPLALKVGGVLGFCDAGNITTINGATNAENIKIFANTDSSTGTDSNFYGLFAGGVLGLSSAATSYSENCKNLAGGDIVIIAGKSLTRASVGGVAGQTHGGFKDFVNNASTLSFTGGSSSQAASYCRIGGLVGHVTGQPVLTNSFDMNVNKAGITVDSAAKLMVGGTVAYSVRDCDKLRNEGDISVTAKGELQAVGGIIGNFARNKLTNSENIASISIERDASSATSDNLSSAGLCVGFLNSEAVFSGCVVSGSLVFSAQDGSSIPLGIAAGKLNANLTLGAENAPFHVKMGSDPKPSVLVGDINNHTLTTANVDYE